MKNNKYFYAAIGVVVSLIVFGSIWWGVLRPEKDIRNDADTGKNEGAPDVPLAPSDDSGAETRNPPTGYNVLDESAANMPEDRRASYRAQFKDALKRIEENPGQSSLWTDLGNIKYAFKDYRGAEAVWTYAIIIDSNAFYAYANLAQLYWHVFPDYPKAEAMFKAVLVSGTIDAVRIPVYRDLSDLYRYDYKEKGGLADDILLEGIREYPESKDLTSYLARYYYETGDTLNAIKYFERYLLLDPDNASAKGYLEELRAKQP